MGLEPTTFCMARASDVRTCSRAFAQTGLLLDLRPCDRTRANPSERRTLPFLPRLGRRRDASVEQPRAAHLARFAPEREHRRAGATSRQVVCELSVAAQMTF
jgi:hypothetical protein